MLIVMAGDSCRHIIEIFCHSLSARRLLRLLGILKAARGLVQTHLDALCGACMLAGIEMKIAPRQSEKAASAWPLDSDSAILLLYQLDCCSL